MSMEAFTYRSQTAEVRFGHGNAAANVRDWVERHHARRILLVTSPSQSVAAELITSAIHARVVGLFSDVVEHVPAETAALAQQAAENSDADLILSIGGGSTTGTAKAIALRTGLPILAVPTTLAGSEMTDVWGITVDGRKQTGKNPLVQPRAVVYDPALLTSLPHAVAVSSAFNALAHCVEAFWGPGANPLTSLKAGEGIRQLTQGLRALQNAQAGAMDSLVYGSFLAGSAFAEAGSGLHHKICHALGGAFDLSHAGTHTVILPQVLRFNADAVPAASRSICAALGVDDAVAGLRELLIATGAPRNLRELGMQDDDVPVAVDVVAERLPIPNPREVTRGDIQWLLQAAFDEGTIHS